jgi:hypothetical protein
MDFFAKTRGTEDEEGGEEVNLSYFLIPMTDHSPALPLSQTGLA